MMKERLETVFLLIAGFVWVFLFGGLVSWLLVSHTDWFISRRPNPTAFEKFRQEYDIVLITKDTPYKVVYVDYYKVNGSIHGNVHYFDGLSWAQSSFATESVVVSSAESSDLSRYYVKGKLDAAGVILEIEIPEIRTDMAVRARSGYTKFGGATDLPSARMTVDEVSLDCYSGLLVGFNATEDLADWTLLGVRTDWLMYFDKDWNFYHLDKTTVEKYSPLYESHSFFAKSSESDVSYCTDFSVARSDDVFTVESTKLRRLDLKIGARFNRIDYGGTSYGSLVQGDGGGVGVYLNIDAY